MNKLYLSFLSAFLLMFPFVTATAQDQVANRVIEIANKENKTMEHLDILTNRIGGRLVGSDAYTNATYWVASMLEKWGLEVEISEVGQVPVGFNRGPWFGRMLSEDGMHLHFATPSYTSGTKGVQRGHVVMEPKNRAEFERMKGKLKGAWVLITGTSNGFPIDHSEYADTVRSIIIKENEKIKSYNDSVSRINRLNTNKKQLPIKEYKDEPALFYKEMRDAGILGIIQSAPVPITALYDRKNLEYMDFDNLPTCPDIKLDQHQYEIIEQKVKERQYFQLEFDIRNHFKPGPVKFHNIIGIIKGTEFPDEFVMSGGHLDAFDVATGGVDCGTGVAPNMEAARLLALAGAKPKRSIMFCFWAAEEFGLWGSKHWVENNPEKLENISNYFNRDGGPTVANSLTVPPAMYQDFKIATKELDRINPDFPFSLNIREGEPRPKPVTAGGSDHAWFAINGVPTISFGTADPKGYDFNYREIWHTERDTYNMSIPEYMEHTSIVTAIVVYNLANLNTILSRDGLYQKPDKKETKKKNKGNLL
ncbi:MAG: M28 family metallopeptidase [Bacteroidales bacterium]